MKALTVLQPWAWALVHGPKRIENRSRPISHRGPLVIHAGQSRKWVTSVLPDGTAVPERLAFGALIGVVDVIDCVPYAEVADDPFAVGPWCWLVANAQPFARPVPWKGQQNLFRVPAKAIRYGNSG